MKQSEKAQVVGVCVLIILAGCSGAGGGETDPEPTVEPNQTIVTNSSVFTSELNATLSGYQRINRTDGIDVIIQVETTNETKFVNTAKNINQTTSVKFLFPDQGLIAANATPPEIETIANMPRVTRIGVDQEVSASSD
jgi:hypothetical protein